MIFSSLLNKCKRLKKSPFISVTKGGNLNSLLVLKWSKNIPSALFFFFLLISFTNVLFSGPRLWNVLCTRYSLSTSHQSPNKRLFSQSVSLHLSFAIYLVHGHSFRCKFICPPSPTYGAHHHFCVF